MISLSKIKVNSVPAVQEYIMHKQLPYMISCVRVAEQYMFFLTATENDQIGKDTMVAKIKKQPMSILLSPQDLTQLANDQIGDHEIRNQIYQYLEIQ
jgi:hypothetical protein